MVPSCALLDFGRVKGSQAATMIGWPTGDSRGVDDVRGSHRQNLTTWIEGNQQAEIWPAFDMIWNSQLKWERPVPDTMASRES